MTTKPNLEAPKQTSHRPFVIRKTIVLSAATLAVGSGVFFGNPILALALYFGFVTFFDALNHEVLGLKPSDFANPKALLKSEKVTGKELDLYFDTRRNIRLRSFCVASLFLFFAYVNSVFPLEIFCLAYIISTLAGILFARFFVKIKRPRLIYRDDRYYVPGRFPRPGCISIEQFALRRTGIYFYGPVDF